MGMTGNQDRAGRAQAWSGDRQDDFMAMIDDDVAVLKASPTASGDVTGAARRIRAVGTAARSVRAVVALSPSSRSRGDRQPEEDEMQNRDDSPENLERLRADLQDRLDRLNAVFEAKGIVVEPGCWPAARADQQPLHAP